MSEGEGAAEWMDIEDGSEAFVFEWKRIKCRESKERRLVVWHGSELRNFPQRKESFSTGTHKGMSSPKTPPGGVSVRLYRHLDDLRL